MIKLLLLLSLSLSAAELGWDGDVYRVGAQAVTGKSQVTITIDNQPVPVGAIGILEVDSDDPNISIRDFQIGEGSVSGQFLSVVCKRTGTFQARITDDSPVSGGTGIVKLAGNWICNQSDNNVLLQWDPPNWRQVNSNL